MIRSFLKRHILKNRALMLREIRFASEFMRLLLKQRNTGRRWTKEETILLRYQLRHILLYVPVLIIFVLPFGTLLLPLLAEILDRRDEERGE